MGSFFNNPDEIRDFLWQVSLTRSTSSRALFLNYFFKVQWAPFPTNVIILTKYNYIGFIE